MEEFKEQENHPIYQIANRNSALRQGEILTDLVQYKPLADELSSDIQGSELSLTVISHPYSIIVTQDCDLDWDYKARYDEDEKQDKKQKFLNSIILCEVATAHEVRNLSEINSSQWGLIKTQRHERFYFFEKIKEECDLKQEGLPELTADFKKIFGIEAEILYRQIDLGIAQRRTTLSNPYLEHFSQRYHSYHGRIALPSQYKSEPEGQGKK